MAPVLLNHRKLLQDQQQLNYAGETTNGIINTLGLSWNQVSDNFTYTIINFEKAEIITKRRILSNITSLYDSLGLISPIIVLAKLIMRKLWKSNLNRNDSIPMDLAIKWDNI